MADESPLATPRALQLFGRELGRVYPLRLAQLRSYGKSMRAVGGRRPKPRKGG